MSRKLVTLEVTDKNAIYINDSRITDRSTKWGDHCPVFSVRVRLKDVLDTLTKNNFPLDRIDKDYAAEAGLII